MSIDTQIELDLKLCKTPDVQHYIDRGFSGKNTQRPDYRRLMEDIASGLIHRVVVYRLDRFSRSLMDFADAWDFMSKYDVEFVSVSENFDTSTPMGKAMIFIMMVFAQLERETIAERVKDNYYQRTKLGRWPGGPAPYGFANGKTSENTSTLTIIDKMEVVDKVFFIYDTTDKSLGSIARILNNEGILGAKSNTWNNNTLSRILRNPVYVKADIEIYKFFKALGVSIDNEIEGFDGEYGGMLVGKRGASTRQRTGLKYARFSLGNWPGRIPSDRWLRVQKKLKSNEQVSNNGKGTHSWLTGIIKCGHCKMAVVVSSYRNLEKRMIKYLYCSGKKKGLCDQTLGKLYVEEVQENVSCEIKNLLLHCKEQKFEEAKIQNDEKVELVQIEEKIKNLIDFISSGGATEATINHINSELQRLESEKDEIINKARVYKPVKIVMPKMEFDELDFEEKKIVAKSLIDKVFIFEDSLEIVWRV